MRDLIDLISDRQKGITRLTGVAFSDDGEHTDSY
jgi:hypothetical protein